MAKGEAAAGRPSIFTPEMAEEICRRLADGETLRQVCRDEHLPAERTVRNWALDDVQGFGAQYERARKIGYLAMADELLEIGDDGSGDWIESKGEGGDSQFRVNKEAVQRSKLRCENRKWLLSKALPKVFGERQAVEVSGPEGQPLADLSEADIDKRLQELMAKFGKSGEPEGGA